MNRFKILVWTVGILGGLLITSCEAYKPNAKVVFSEYSVSTVGIPSVSNTDTYAMVKPYEASATVNYVPGSYVQGDHRSISIDGKLVYQYNANGANKEGQWLKSFNDSKLDLGFVQGSIDSIDVEYPDPRALARHIAYAKVIKELIAIGGDAITMPVISTVVDGYNYTTTVKTNLVKLNTKK